MHAIIEKVDSLLAQVQMSLDAPTGAKFQLRDIDVEEVSLVDHPANRHRFIIVKRAGGTGGEASVNKIKLTEEVQADILKALVDGLESLSDVMTLVRKAVTVHDKKDVVLPLSMGRELFHIQKTLVSVLESHMPEAISKEASMSNLGTETADKMKLIGALMMEVAEADSPMRVAEIAEMALGAAAEKALEGAPADLLKQIAEVSKALTLKTEDQDTLPEGTADTLRALATGLNELAGVEPANKDAKPAEPAVAPAAAPPVAAAPVTEPAAPAVAPAAVPAAPVTEPVAVAPVVAAPAAVAPAPVVAAPAPVVAAPAPVVAAPAAVAAPAPVAAPVVMAEPSALEKLAAMHDQIGTLLAQAGIEVAKRADAAIPVPPQGVSNVGVAPVDGKMADNSEGKDAPEFTAVLKTLKELQEKVDKMAATPQAPASRSEHTDDDRDGVAKNGNSHRRGQYGVW